MIIKGFIDDSVVTLSINKLNCLSYKEDNIKEFDLSDYKTIQIINIKGFKSFLRNKDIQEFKDITLIDNELIFKGITFKKGITQENLYSYIELLDNDNNRIVCINLDFIKPIFKEFKNNDVSSLRLFYKNDFPAYFEININQGFLIAPMIIGD